MNLSEEVLISKIQRNTFSFQLINGRCIAFGSWPSEELRQIFGILITFLTFMIPFIILVFCYSKIVWMLTRRIHKGINTSQNTDTKKGNIQDKNRDTFELARTNTIKTLLIVGCCYIICWSPNQFLYLVYNFGYNVDWNSTFFHFTVVMIFANSMVNPFIYVFKYRDYQIAMKKCLLCKKQDELNASSPSNSVQSVSNRF